MKYLSIILIFTSTLANGQTLVDSTETTYGRLIYAADGSIIGKDSLWQKRYTWDEDGEYVYRYVDTLIRHVSYLNTEAVLRLGTDDSSSSVECSTEEGCDVFVITFDRAIETPGIIVSNDYKYIQIVTAGFYQIDYGCIAVRTGGGYDILFGLTKSDTGFSGIDNSKIKLQYDGIEWLAAYRTIDVYLMENEHVYLMINMRNNDSVVNPYLRVKLKLPNTNN